MENQSAEKRNLELKGAKIEKAITTYKRAPKLAIILVGENPASLSYVKGKKKACELVGIINEMYHLSSKHFRK